MSVSHLSHHERRAYSRRGTGRVVRWLAALACLAVIPACGSLRANTSAVKSPAVSSSPAYVKRADLLNGVSCVSPNACWAVGAYYYGTAAGYTLVDRWDGSAWRVQPSPDSVRYSVLSGVACPGEASRMAVGAAGIFWS